MGACSETNLQHLNAVSESWQHPSAAFLIVKIFAVTLLLMFAGAVCSAAAVDPAEDTASPRGGTVSPQVLMTEGEEHARRGDFIEARIAWQKAVEAFAAQQDLSGETLALVRSAEASLALGQFAKAVDTLRRALDIATPTGDNALEATVNASLGNAYAMNGRAEMAKAMLESSVTLAEQTGDQETAASASNNLGNLLAGQGRFDEATRAYRRAIDGAEAAGNKALLARATANLARLSVDTAQYAEASKRLNQSLRLVEGLPATHQKAYDLISIGRLYTRIAYNRGNEGGHPGRQAHRALSEAGELAASLGDSGAESYAQGYLGNLYERSGRYGEALQLTQKAIVAAQEANIEEALYRWQWQSGRILAAQGETETAILSYQQAVYTLESIRQDVNAGLRARQASFRDTAGPVYFELADLLLQRSATDENSDQVAQDLVDARQTVELLKGAELEDYFQDDCVAALQAKTTGIDQLEDRTVAIYPIILDDRTELLLSLPDGLERFTVDVDRETLTAEVLAFRQKLEKRTTHEYYPHARQLYDWLIRPLEAELQRGGIETVVIVPDAALRTIPLGALHDGNQFLIERYALATTPGLTLTDPRPIERKDVELLANGLSMSVQGFPSLPSVDGEIASISSLYDGTVLKNGDFVVGNMQAALSENPYSIVHIASHGQFDGNIDNTFLLTYDGKLSMDELEQFIASTKFREDAVELLTLSACQTAAGDDRAALGLAGVAVKAGARSAMATLWTVNDPASAALVTDFYEQLKNPQMSKAKALQQAQLNLSRNLRFWHPSYWSPFLLIGNWQ